jgi:chemosensory pili system protein ChpA (sensor histidine kinase/response regulator)
MGVSDRLAQDLVFFCARPRPAPASAHRSWTAVRQAWNLGRFSAGGLRSSQFGRFDPVLLAQARKRIRCGQGNLVRPVWRGYQQAQSRGRPVQPGDRLAGQAACPASGRLANALGQRHRDRRPLRPAAPAELAMEVATSILYLEAALRTLTPSTPNWRGAPARLADRLSQGRAGRSARAAGSTGWKSCTGGSATGRPWAAWWASCGHPVRAGKVCWTSSSATPGQVPLARCAGQLIADAGRAVRARPRPGITGRAAHARQCREILVTEIDEEKARAAGTFDKLGNNLGALGFLIDMLNYQPRWPRSCSPMTTARASCVRSWAAPKRPSPISGLNEPADDSLSPSMSCPIESAWPPEDAI